MFIAQMIAGNTEAPLGATGTFRFYRARETKQPKDAPEWSTPMNSKSAMVSRSCP